MRTRLPAPVLGVALLLGLVAACGSDDTTVGTGGEGSTSSSTEETTTTSAEGAAVELAAARDRWDAAAILDYDMTYQAVCFCPQQETTVTVRGGEIVDAQVTGDPEYADDPLTVEDLFADIDEAITSGAASVEAGYDADTGRPLSYYIDQSEMMADEEHGVTVSAFEVVAPS